MICGKLEAEVAQLPEAERADFLAHAGLAECGLDALIRAGYRILHLETFFTAGPKEVRAWTVPVGTTAPEGGGRHPLATSSAASSARRRSGSRTTSPAGGEAGAKERGKMRIEGKAYVVQDGDVIYFRFSV